MIVDVVEINLLTATKILKINESAYICRSWVLFFTYSSKFIPSLDAKMAIVLPRYFDFFELGLDSDRDSTLCLTELSTDLIDGEKKSLLMAKLDKFSQKDNREFSSIIPLYEVATENDIRISTLASKTGNLIGALIS